MTQTEADETAGARQEREGAREKSSRCRLTIALLPFMKVYMKKERQTRRETGAREPTTFYHTDDSSYVCETCNIGGATSTCNIGISEAKWCEFDTYQPDTFAAHLRPENFDER